MNDLIDRYRADEGINCALTQRPNTAAASDLAYSTAVSYASFLERHIRPRWGRLDVDGVRPYEVQKWLNELDLAPRTRGHIRALLHRLFQFAALLELRVDQNPLRLTRVRGISRRRRRPSVLTVGQFHAIAGQLPRQYSAMVWVAQLSGLRASELLALKWCDVNFRQRTIQVTRAVVHGRVKQTKTEYSEDALPLSRKLAQILRSWQKHCPVTSSGWVFPSRTDRARGKPFHASPIQQDYLRPVGEAVGVPHLGFHTFRHTYRALLDLTGAPVAVQKSLMRHASALTTLNFYGTALERAKRDGAEYVGNLVRLQKTSRK